MEKSQEQDRQQILDLVADYCRKYHLENKKPYEPGDRIPYASRVYDEKEMVNLVDSALEFWLTAGRYTDEFEEKLAKYLGVRYCFSGQFRFFCQSGGLYGSDLSSAQGAAGTAGR